MSEPTKLMMWRAVRVTPPKVPVTLADCEEGRLAVVRFETGTRELMIRKRIGYLAYDSEGYSPETPSKYIFVRYLDDQQPTAQPVPTTFGELRDGQCFRLSPDHSVLWRAHNECMWVLVSGKIGSNNPSSDEPIEFIPDIEMVLEEQPC